MLVPFQLDAPMYYRYVLQSTRDGRWYTGVTGDLKTRVADHLNGRVQSTRPRRPLRLIYYEACLSEADAKRRERYLKTGRGKHYIRQRLAVGPRGNSPE